MPRADTTLIAVTLARRMRVTSEWRQNSFMILESHPIDVKSCTTVCGLTHVYTNSISLPGAGDHPYNDS